MEYYEKTSGWDEKCWTEMGILFCEPFHPVMWLFSIRWNYARQSIDVAMSWSCSHKLLLRLHTTMSVGKVVEFIRQQAHLLMHGHVTTGFWQATVCRHDVSLEHRWHCIFHGSSSQYTTTLRPLAKPGLNRPVGRCRDKADTRHQTQDRSGWRLLSWESVVFDGSLYGR